MKKEEIRKRKWYTIYRILSDLFSDKFEVVTSWTMKIRLYCHLHDPHSPFYKKDTSHLRIEPITTLFTDFISTGKLEEAFTRDYIRNNYPIQNAKYGNVASPKLQKKMNTAISKALKGKSFTESHKKNISKALKGNIIRKKGKKLSEAHKQNISKGHMGIPIPKKSREAFIEYNRDRNKPIIDNDTKIKYKNIKETSEKLNILIKDIRDSLHNRIDKYHFKFL